MTPIPDSATCAIDRDVDPVAAARMTRPATCRAMQLELKGQRRQQISRRRLLALLGAQPWGWVAL